MYIGFSSLKNHGEITMKRKLLLGLILTAVCSANSFAMEITHGKLISHKEWTMGKLAKSSSFKEVNNLNIPALRLPSLKMKGDVPMPPVLVANNTVLAQSVVSDDLTAVVGQDVSLSGFNYVDITNNGSTPKTYVINTM